MVLTRWSEGKNQNDFLTPKLPTFLAPLWNWVVWRRKNDKPIIFKQIFFQNLKPSLINQFYPTQSILQKNFHWVENSFTCFFFSFVVLVCLHIIGVVCFPTLKDNYFVRPLYMKQRRNISQLLLTKIWLYHNVSQVCLFCRQISSS